MYIDRNEALRYMGYKGQSMDENMEKLLDACINEVLSVSRGSFLYKIFDMERAEEGLRLKGTTLVLSGNDIHVHLSEAKKCALMAVTLGLEIDRRIAFYSKTDLAKGLIFDACAAAAVESLCDTVQEEIEAEARAMGFKTTTRYSPGYGDFPIEIQKDITRVMDTYRKIGLGVNESSIMIPRKSVTAVIGMQTEKRYKEKNMCKVCNNRDCLFGKDVKGND